MTTTQPASHDRCRRTGRLPTPRHACSTCSADDAGGEARPARRLLGQGRRRGGRPAAGGVRRGRRPRRGQPARARPPDPALRHPPGRPGRAGPVAVGVAARAVTGTRLGIPALVHEECLTGLAAWKAATFPTPLAWGAAFDPELVEEMAALIGASMRALGIHQGLAPVLDVIRDPRWGRVEECIAEDPYLVGTIGTSYVRGLQSAGVHATLKHFVGYSASQAGRNFAPVHAGPARARRRAARPVRDGGPRRRRPVGHALLRRDRRGAGRRRPRPAHRRAARAVGLRRHGRRRLLRGRVPAPAAPRRGRPRRGGRAGARRRRRHRAAHRRRLPRPARRRGARRPGRRGARRPRGAAGAGPEGGARAARRDVRRRAAAATSTSTVRSTAGSRPGWPRSRWCCSPTTAPSR